MLEVTADKSVASRHPDANPTLLHAFFHRSRIRCGSRPAVEIPPGADRGHRQTESYDALGAQAARVTAALARHVRGECIVAVFLPRTTPWLFAAQLGVLQAGAAFACLDAEVPLQQLGHVLRDAAPVAVITDRRGRDHLRALQLELAFLCVEELPAAPIDDQPPTPPWLGPSTLAYVIYTSGTTGTPKGVLIEHRNIANLIAAGLAHFDLSTGDRVAQGSSPAYDSSLEETWLAFAAGATVVVMDAETTRLGPDLPDWLRHERISVLMPTPTLLRMMALPDPHAALPDLRLVYAGGEALPQDLADRWSDGIWLENGYGPTECTVTCVRGRLHRGVPVHIGRAVRGNVALVLDDELLPVAVGDVGELCIAGAGLARGYLNQPALTAERFPDHPQHGRIYRTGDLVRTSSDGNLICLGRRDAQVKVRGHRIELEAVESTLAALPGVRAAGCRLQGNGAAAELVAFVVADDPSAPPDVRALRRSLETRLPPAAVPARIGILASLTTTVGGKLDRKALPELPPEEDHGSSDTTAATATVGDPQLAALADLAARCLGRRHVDVDADFFTELGGNSLRAAELITRLRDRDADVDVAVRDLYELRTLRALARQLDRTAPNAAGGPPIPNAVPAWPRLVTIGQAIALLLGLCSGAALFWLLWWHALPVAATWLDPLAALLLLPLAFTGLWIAAAPLLLLFAVAAKRLLIGRYRPGRQPVWSGFYLRHWLVQRAVRLLPWTLIQGTCLQAMALRCLGARIGKRVHLHRGVDLLGGGWDLLRIDDGASIGLDAELRLVQLDRGALDIGPIHVGADATIDVRAGMAPGSSLGDGAFLAALSSLPSGAVVPAGERWDGVPARPTGAAVPPPAGPFEELGEMQFALLALLLRCAAIAAFSAPFALLAAGACHLAGWTSSDLLTWLQHPLDDMTTLLVAAGTALAAIPLQLALHGLLLRLTPVPAGSCSRWSLRYLRLSLRTRLLEQSGSWLSGTLLWPLWLRLAGMRIGRNCEISTISDVLPEHTAIGDESFLADGIYLGSPLVHRGTVTVGRSTIGSRVFLGNHVVIPPGGEVPDDVLLGVCTVATPGRLRPQSDWFGHPPFELPRREVRTAERELTHEPGPLRYLNRLGWEVLRFALAPAVLLATLGWLHLIVQQAGTAPTAAAAIAAGVAATLVIASAGVLLCLLLKWSLLGRVKPGEHALWSCWCSRWDFLYVAWERLARRQLEQLAGTLLLVPVLRWSGMQIGKNVVLGRGFAHVVDPDMLHFGDGATVDGLFQAHSFEDRVLKIDHVHIRAGATLQHGALMLYGGELGTGTHVAAHSVVMKHERLRPQRCYDGSPTRLCR